MKLICDQGLERSTASRLRAMGFDAVHTREIGLARASDETIIEEALRSGAIIATYDSDFHQLLALTGASEPSVIRLRDPDLSPAQLASQISDVLERFADELASGVALTVRRGLVRIRSLPLAARD